MTASQENIIALDVQSRFERVIEKANQIILGKEHTIRLALSCMLAQGHVLIEDQPGVGKTTLANVLATLLGLSIQRIQFTSDLLPADILGVSVYNRDSESFSFHPGPVFSQVVLADEVNRATPRAQSALLEAMEEYQVTIEGETRKLPEPFFVIATQNPSSQVGTFPLPESQLDRFMMRLELGYPDGEAERELLKGRDRRELLAETSALISVEELRDIQARVESVFVADALLDYLQNLLDFSRMSTDFANGLSPRSGLAVLHCARAWALLHGHEQVLPEDIQTVLPSIIGHRLKLNQESGDSKADSVADVLIRQVPIP
ncbi:MAG: AAA domain-containing protein [Gammaproteobacteria bacterium]|nr:AAA domain-containing protein [Gammaproteobacteria bacterium]